MANWCVNIVSFTGDRTKVLAAVQLIKALSFDENTNNSGHIPDFLDLENISMFKFAVNDHGVYFRSPWVPEVEAVKQIAAHYQLDYIHKYEEYGMKLCGEACTRSGVFTEISIDGNDLKAIRYDRKNEKFAFEGHLYEDDWTIIVEMLDRKRKLRDKAPFESGGIPANPLQTKMIQPQLSQLELVAWRLAGRLPHIDINGTDFTIDIRLLELRETASPWNRIDIRDMESSVAGDDYEFFYDTLKRNVWHLDDHIMQMPENVILVNLPNELILDPVAAARSVGFEDTRFLDEYPIQADLKAGITALSETFLPGFIEENRRKNDDPTSMQRSSNFRR